MEILVKPIDGLSFLSHSSYLRFESSQPAVVIFYCKLLTWFNESLLSFKGYIFILVFGGAHRNVSCVRAAQYTVVENIVTAGRENDTRFNGR